MPRATEVPGGPTPEAVLATVRNARFARTARFHEGYDIAEVDAFLGAIEAAIADRSPVQQMIATSEFTLVRMREGYDTGEVDAFLAKVLVVAADLPASDLSTSDGPVRESAGEAIWRIYHTRFSTVRRFGYRIDQVDALLDALVEALDAERPLQPVLDRLSPSRALMGEGYAVNEVERLLTTLGLRRPDFIATRSDSDAEPRPGRRVRVDPEPVATMTPNDEPEPTVEMSTLADLGLTEEIPAVSEPRAADEAPTTETSAGDTGADEALAEEASTEEPPADEATTDEPPTEELSTEELSTEEDSNEEALAEEVAADEPPADEPPADEPPTEEVPADEARAEAPVDEVPAEEVLTEEAPVEEVPAEEALIGEVPVDETPTEEAPVDEVPAEDAPVDEAPTDEAPTDEALTDEALTDEAPAHEDLALEETPALETPTDQASAEEVSAEEAPAEETPVEEAPVEEAPTDETPAEEAPGDETLVDEALVDETPADDTGADVAHEEPAEPEVSEAGQVSEAGEVPDESASDSLEAAEVTHSDEPEQESWLGDVLGFEPFDAGSATTSPRGRHQSEPLDRVTPGADREAGPPSSSDPLTPTPTPTPTQRQEATMSSGSESKQAEPSVATRTFEVTMHAVDPGAQSAFWCEALGYVVAQGDDSGQDSDRVVTVPGQGGGPRVAFVKIPRRLTGVAQARLDINVASGLEGQERMVALLTDATRLARHGGALVKVQDDGGAIGGWHLVMRDPEDNEFLIL